MSKLGAGLIQSLKIFDRIVVSCTWRIAKKPGANNKVKWQLFNAAILESKYPQLVSINPYLDTLLLNHMHVDADGDAALIPYPF